MHIVVTQRLDNNTCHLEILLCYDTLHGATNEEEDTLLVVEPPPTY
jgi:hypothetical protein